MHAKMTSVYEINPYSLYRVSLFTKCGELNSQIKIDAFGYHLISDIIIGAISVAQLKHLIHQLGCSNKQLSEFSDKYILSSLDIEKRCYTCGISQINI